MGESTSGDYVDAIDAQMRMMGWRYFPQFMGGKWRKMFPPPHEVENGSGKLRFIGEQGSRVWKIDVDRARHLVAMAGGPHRPPPIDKPN